MGSGGGGGGGGGAGMGGALFVQQGGTLTLNGPLTVNGNTVTAGSGASNGSAFGSGLFLHGNGTIAFAPGSGETQTVADVIADQTGSGGTAGNAGSYALTKSGAGTLALNGTNTYTGATTVSAGTLRGTGSVSGPLAVASGGTVAPGNSVGPFGSGNFSVTGAGGTLAIELDPTNSGGKGTSDKLNVAGTVTLTGGNLAVSLLSPPSIGDTFVIINNDGVDAVTGTFSTANGSPIVANQFTVAGCSFLINYAGLTGSADGNDVTLTVTVAPTPSLVVTTTADEDNGTSDPTWGSGTSLREAITFANSDPDTSTITFQSGLNGTIQLGSILTLTASANINGPSDQSIIVRGNGVAGFSLFAVNTGFTVQLSNLTLSNSNAGVDNNGTLNVTACTFSGNGPGVLNNGSATLVNSTFSGNGAGVYNLDTATINHCTIVNGFTGVTNNGGTVNLTNSIVAGNTTDVNGGLGTDTNNLKNMSAAAAGLDSAGLQNNGGPTATIALVQGSPAINKANSALTTDQRGVSRPQGSASDIGAYEAVLLSIGDQSITEGDSGTSNATFTVTLSAALDVPLSVNYAIANGSAKASSDFDSTNLSDSDGATSGALTISAGQTTGSITVPIIGDTINEASEVFYVLLSSPSGAICSKGRATGTITDNDATLAALSINDVTINEGNSGTRNANFTLSLNAPSGKVVSVDVATANDTATAGADYTALSTTTISLSPGQTQRTVTIPVAGDVTKENNESFFVNLSNAVNASLSDSQGVGTITDDDRTPSLSIADVSIAEGNSGTTTLTFTVTLSAVSGQTVTVNYATADGTAKAATDYVSKSGSLGFAPGDTSKTISISLNGDVLVESDEVFYLVLSGASNASLGRSRAIGTITNDDSS